MVFADEIYDQILYDDAVHHSVAALAPDLVVLTFCGLSKTYRVAASARAGWWSPARSSTRRAIWRA